METPQTENTFFYKKLSFNDHSFEIKLTGKKLTIQLTGLTADNSKVEQEIEGTIGC